MERREGIKSEGGNAERKGKEKREVTSRSQDSHPLNNKYSWEGSWEMESWLRRKESGEKGKKGGEEEKKVVLDGTEIRELVENKEAFTSFVEHKFQELDVNHDGKLSVKELQPAVADIGAALGLPAQGTSPDSDHIYSEVPAFSTTAST